MATAPMRHFNSPEERAKREDEPEGVKPQHRGFRHYNHPEEIAKREREGAAGSAVVVPKRQPRRVVETEGWPPAGEENTASLAVTTSPALPPRARPMAPLSGEDPQQRLELLEAFVYALLDSPSEAREFRLQLNNQAAATEAVGDLIRRVRALEQTLEVLTAPGDDDDDDDDDGEGGAGDDEPKGDTQPPPGGAGNPPPTEPAT